MIQQGCDAGDEEGSSPCVGGVHSESEGLLAFLQARWSQVPARKREKGGQRGCAEATKHEIVLCT